MRSGSRKARTRRPEFDARLYNACNRYQETRNSAITFVGGFASSYNTYYCSVYVFLVLRVLEVDIFKICGVRSLYI